jgi:predicted transcriptional regulator
VEGKSVHPVRDWFAGKATVRCVVPTAALDLRLNERLAYSWLVYRARYGRGSTRAGLAEGTGLHRTKTVPRVVARLLDLGLVQRRGKLLFAKQPGPGLFSCTADSRRRDDPWYKRLNYFVIVMRSAKSPLTTTQAAVLSVLYSQNMRDGLRVNPSARHLASLLRVSVKTVRSALRRLEECGLVAGGTLVPPTAEMLAWWKDRPHREQCEASGQGDQTPGWDNYSQWFPKLIESLDAYLPEDWTAIINKIGRAFGASDYPFQQATDLFVEVLNGPNMKSIRAAIVRNVPTLVRKAEEATRKYRDLGKFHGANSLVLFRKMARAELKRLKNRLSA